MNKWILIPANIAIWFATLATILDITTLIFGYILIITLLSDVFKEIMMLSMIATTLAVIFTDIRERNVRKR